jgi:hypothetical protein
VIHWYEPTRAQKLKPIAEKQLAEDETCLIASSDLVLCEESDLIQSKPANAEPEPSVLVGK